MCANGHSQINPSIIQSPCVHTRRFKAIAQFLQLECRLWYKYMASGRNNRQHPLRRRSHIQRSTQRKDQTAHDEEFEHSVIDFLILHLQWMAKKLFT